MARVKVSVHTSSEQSSKSREDSQPRESQPSGAHGTHELERARRARPHETLALGGHRGRGPRNFQRSDERIYHDVCERLTDDHLIDATEITVAVENGEVTLAGSVISRQQKRRAESILDDISGVRDVHNQLRVQLAAVAPPEERSSRTDTEERSGGHRVATPSPNIRPTHH